MNLAFASARELGELIRTKKISSLALDRDVSGRLKKYDPTLESRRDTVRKTPLAAGPRRRREIAAGKITAGRCTFAMGAKDLLAVEGYRNQWGAGGFESQMIDEDATVVKRLDEAGAYSSQN